MSSVADSRPRIKPELKPSGKRRWLYATVPNEWVWPRPVIRHRQEDDDDYGLAPFLSPFEYAVALAVLNLAGAALAELRHREAIAAGGALITEEKKLHAQFRQGWRATHRARQAIALDGEDAEDAPDPEELEALLRQHTFGQPEFKPMPIKKALQKAGAAGYRKARSRQQKAPPPEQLTVTTSRRALLAAAQLTYNGRNKQRIEAALQRLTKKVARTKPLLKFWQQVKNTLQLEVAGCWLEPPYIRVPLPLPLHSPAALALYLFLHRVRTGVNNTKGIRFAELCTRLGIVGPWRNRQRDLNRAIQAVNGHLAKLPDADARELFALHQPLVVADHYSVEVDGAYVRFVARSRLVRWHSDDAERRRRREDREAEAGENWRLFSRPQPPPEPTPRRSSSNNVQQRRRMLAEEA
jgi:hypothetical protein